MKLPADLVEFFLEGMRKANSSATEDEAARRFLEVMYLIWILGHKPPKEGEPYRDPPPPPWL